MKYYRTVHGDTGTEGKTIHIYSSDCKYACGLPALPRDREYKRKPNNTPICGNCLKARDAGRKK